jgi:SAM-dependent MidA family methyltransferase
MPADSSPCWPWTDDAPLRFDRFMERALHDPRRGYYARRIAAVGRGGDFTTAPMVSNAVARALAHEIRKSGLVHLIEMGAGEGTLSAAVIRALPWWVRWKIRLHIVETSQPLREKQKRLLGSKATWHDTPSSALDACQGKAFIFSNELIDAFPVRCFRKSRQGWEELFLLPGLNPMERWVASTDLPPSSAFAVSHALGQSVEVHDSVRRWLAEWLPHWKSGCMMVIDYGDEAGAIFHRRPQGTLRAYLLQQRLEGPAVYQNAGRQDLTADVNFTDLSQWMKLSKGSSTLLTQREFLLPFSDLRNPADTVLIDPAGAGTAFKVMKVTKEEGHSCPFPHRFSITA